MTTISTMQAELRVGEWLQIGATRITLAKKDGQRARLVVQAPKDMPIRRMNQTSAQECASTPETGKEYTHGKHPV